MDRVRAAQALFDFHVRATITKIPLDMRDYSDAAARHEQLVRRQHFMDRGVAPPTGPQF